MNKKGQIGMIISITLLVIFLVWVIVGFVIVHESHTICDNYCAEQGSSTYDVIENGEYFSTDDMCVCYFEDGRIINHRNNK